MRTRGIALGALLLVAALVSACGGGGGGGGGPVLALNEVETPGLPNGGGPIGSTNGGDTVILKGSGFGGQLAGVNVTVEFGSTPATVTQVTSTQVTAISPPGPEGLVDITVTNPDGSSVTMEDAFEYIAPPTIQEVVATGGPTTGESRADVDGVTPMEIRGTNFRDGMTASVGGTPVTVTVAFPTRATFTAPAVTGEPTAGVTVANPEGLQATLPAAIVYTAEFSLTTADDNLTEEEVRHLFRRAAFGGSPARIAEAVSDGLATTVDKLMNYVNDDGVEAEALNTYTAAQRPPAGNLNTRVNKQWWLHLMLKNPNGFQERMAFALHDHFATSENPINADFRWTMKPQVQLFRRFSMSTSDTNSDGDTGLGYDWFRILVEVAKDRAILEWLDGRQSTANNPNENFPRELWELFSLGEGNGYTEFDIQEASKALTGFFWFRPNPSDPRGSNQPTDYLEIGYNPNNHDDGNKTVFGVTDTFGYDSVTPFHRDGTGVEVDPSKGIVAHTLAMRPIQASEFIVGKLFAYFVYDGTHDSVIDQLATQLRAAGANQWNLEPIIRTMLTSKAFFSNRARRAKVASPVEYLLGLMRDTEVDLNAAQNTNTGRVLNELNAMGQLVLDPPDVNGWFEDTLLWMGAQSQLERFNFLTLLVQELDDVDADISPLIPPAGSRDPASLVDHLANLLDVELTPVARTELIAYVTTEWNNGNPQPFAYDQNDDNHVRMKVRGLIWMIAQIGNLH